MAGSIISFFTIGFLLAAGFPVLGWGANPTEHGLSIRVNLLDYAQVPEDVLAEARRTTAKILLRAGLQATWVDVPTSSHEAADSRHDRQRVGAADLTVRFIPESKVPEWAKKREDLAFSLIPSAGGPAKLSSIYPERVTQVAAWHNHPVGLVLGCVIAHELGHLLLRQLDHSAIGVMSFPVTGHYLRKAARGQLQFTNSQAKRIRREVRKRLERDLAGSAVAGTQNRAELGSF